MNTFLWNTELTNYSNTLLVFHIGRKDCVLKSYKLKEVWWVNIKHTHFSL